MTIAIGLLASDGLVMAADTQETVGSFKMDQSKMLIANRGRHKERAGALAVSGAGWGGHIDSINQELCERFMETPRLSKITLTKEVRSKVHRFHMEHIAPLGGYPSDDRPNFSLLLGAVVGKDRLLWTTHESAIRACRNYGAVGIGSPYARAMLRRYWSHEMDTETAVSLATYIMLNVKKTVDGCGNETQIAYLKNGCANYVSPGNIEVLERKFSEHARYGNLMLHFILGLPVKDEDAELDKFSSVLRKLREEITVTRLIRMEFQSAGIRPLDQPQLNSPDENE
jgi:hypothetical protein